MLFTATFINLVLATAAFAAPRSGSTLAQRVAARAARRGDLLVPSQSGRTAEVASGNNTHAIQFSSNWAGAVLTSPPSGQKFTKVVGTFNVPTPSRPSGTTGSASGSAWVGIDGDTAGNSILQSGIDFTVSSSGAISFDAWFEWFPNFATDFSGFSMSAGNTITVTIVATSSTRGTVTLQNVSTGKSVTQALSAPSNSAALAQLNAEWIVEDFESGGSLVNFANFSPVTFTNCVASTASSSLGVSGAQIIEIESSSNKVLTTVTIPSSSSVKVTHT